MTKETTTASSSSLVKVVIGLWAGVILGAVVIGILAFTGVIPLFGNSGTSADTVDQAAPLAQYESGIKIPEIALTGLDGATVHPSDYLGKVVVLNFWATWCGPCVQEMPMFQEYQDRFPELVVIGVDEQEAPEKVAEFLKQLGLTYTILLDPKADMARELRISFLPTTIIFDETGEIRFRHYGIMAADQMDHYLKTLGVITE